MVLNRHDRSTNIELSLREKKAGKNGEARGPLSRGVALVHAPREIGGDKLTAALLLGIGKTTLDRKLKKYARDPTASIVARMGGALQHGIFLDLHK